MSRDLNWTDLLSQDLDYVVIRKGNRLQVLCQPSPKQLRRRGKRNWNLVAAVQKEEGSNGDSVPPHELREAVMQALADLTGGDFTPPKKVKKKKIKV